MTSPDVSVVIPARNACRTIVRALLSAFAQGESLTIEVIVVDDHSVDNTLELVRGRFPAVRILKSLRNGVSAARNVGLNSAVGRYIAFLDADDEWLPGKLARQLIALDNDQTQVLCATAANYVDENGRFRSRSKTSFAGDALRPLLRGNFILTSSVVVRHSTLTSRDILFNENMAFAEDWQFWLQLSAIGGFTVLNTPLVNYTVADECKYTLELLKSSLTELVNSLSANARFHSRLGANANAFVRIPDLAALSWVRRNSGLTRALSHACRLFLQDPRLAIEIIARLR